MLKIDESLYSRTMPVGGPGGVTAVKEHLRLDREALSRDVDSEDDSEWLDDPVAIGLQPLNAAAASMPGSRDARIEELRAIERPDNVTPETHDLVLKTMLGSDSWAATKAGDDALVDLRMRRLAELRLRAAQGGADGRAAALVASELEDLDGERLVRNLSTMDANDALVVHVHAPSANGSAILDAAVATLAARHSVAKHHREESVPGRGGNARTLPGGGTLSFARLSAVDAGVTARLDMVDVASLPALLLYRAGTLFASQMQVRLPSMAPEAEEGEEREPSRGGAAAGGGGQKRFNVVTDGDDLDQLADECEDLLDDLGLYE
jgi:hypothetical protein